MGALLTAFGGYRCKKSEDKGSDNHSSKHIIIPLTVGRLLTILDEGKITSNTKSFRVKIEAEKGFNPQTDIDLESLRFGSPDQVDYGRGSKALKATKADRSLIVTFEGAGSGFTDNNFAAKMLGKTTRGKLLFGYARLPWVDYEEPIFSPLKPKITKTDNGYLISTENRRTGPVSVAWANAYFVPTEKFVSDQAEKTKKKPAPEANYDQASKVYLKIKDAVSVRQGWGDPVQDKGIDGKPIQIDRKKYKRGIGTHAHSEIVYNIEGKDYQRFHAKVGSSDRSRASVSFELWLDGKKIYDSGGIYLGDPVETVDVDITGGKELKLIVTTGQDHVYDSDHACWADAYFVK